MKTLRLLCFGGMALFLSACATVPKLPRNPHAPAPSAPSLPKGMRPTELWPRYQWWKALHDPVLDRWVARALADNPSLHAAAARVLAAQAVVGVTNARRLPHFDAGLSFTQQYFSAQGLHLSANGTSNFFTELNPIQIRYHIDLWGQDQALVRAARGDAQMVAANLAQARLLLSTAVVLHYVALMGDEALQQKEEQVFQVLHQNLRLSRTAYAAGIGNAQGFLQARRGLATTAARLATLKADCATQRHALAELAGEGPGTAQPKRIPPPFPLLPDARLPADLPLGLLAHCPDIIAARWAMEAAAARVHAARAAFYPDLNLRLLAGWNSIDLGDLFQPGNFAHAVGPVLTLPIFEGGALRSRLRGENALFLATQEQYRARILSDLRQVADILSAWEKLRGQRQAAREALAAARRQLGLAQGAWRSGIGTRLPYLQQQIGYLRARQAIIQLKTASLQNWALLESALGGGYFQKVRNRHGH
ncbi:efflux transporter outer membrane subunit [Acidithiobacillus sp. M4-SHS-6]|uniref:efflux transporter outer membrane subunit n=1 Tax=Acidithiobacillus sp. M4-SHS-6 TaxID=3383024 RepID=UPI0039BDA641